MAPSSAARITTVRSRDAARLLMIARTDGKYSNLSWDAIVLHLTFPDVSGLHELRSATDDERAIGFAFDLVFEFLGEEREAR